MKTEYDHFGRSRKVAESELDREDLFEGEEVIVTENGDYFADSTELVAWLKKTGYFKYVVLGEDE